MIEVEVYNHQSAVDLTEAETEKLGELADLVVPIALKNLVNGGGVLSELELIEVSIVDDPTIAQVHVDFMDVPGATDVITFAHGEIVVSAETARRYALEVGHSVERELFLYIIHGILHLAGHEDSHSEDKALMESLQFSILRKLFPA